MASFSQTRPKVGLVLSGGGAKGLAHVGVIRELEKRGIKPDYITGTSMGALIGGLYACGYTPDELDEIVNGLDWDYLLNDKILRENYLVGQTNKNKTALLSLPLKGITPEFPGGLYAGHNILALIEILTRNYSQKMNFDSLPIPFRCIGTNIETGETKIFNNVRLPDALRASMSIPSVFSPYEVENELFVDGGLVNNFPTDVIKKMGAEIIIGVDVGAIAYKKEEITSIVRVLDQATSFYNYRVTEINKKLCDIYIRPDISKMSMLNFDNVKGVIEEGAIATNNVNDKLDSIFSQYNLLPIVNQKAADKTVNVDDVIVESNVESEKNKREVKRLIAGKINLKKNHQPTIVKIQNEMNRIYASKYFNKVSLTFLPKDSLHYTIVVKAEERRENTLNVGLRYDSQYGVNALINTQFRNLLFYGSLLETSLVAGQSPELKIRYTTDRGSSLGFGTSASYTKFNVYTYTINSVRSTTFDYRRANWDAFVHANIGNFNRVVLGVDYSLAAIESTQSVSDLKNFSDHNVSAFLSYQVDSWDRSFFPNKGLKLKVRGDLVRMHDKSVLQKAWGSLEGVISVSEKVKVMAKVFTGFGSAGVDTTFFRYETGGLAKNRIEWYTSMPGLEFLEHGAANNIVVSLSPRYEFLKNQYITYTFAVGSLNNNLSLLYSLDNTKYMGMSLEYGLLTMFGPMNISVDYSINNDNMNTFVSLGYWF